MSDWIEWSGGECPVRGGTNVALKFRDGETGDMTRARYWDWKHLGSRSDIIAYRVVRP